MAPGRIVRVSVEAHELGNELRLITTWDDLFVPSSVTRRDALHVRIVTGVQLRDVSAGVEGTSAVAGWARRLKVTPDGLEFVEEDGPLAWFRAMSSAPSSRVAISAMASYAPNAPAAVGHALSRSPVRAGCARPVPAGA